MDVQQQQCCIGWRTLIAWLCVPEAGLGDVLPVAAALLLLQDRLNRVKAVWHRQQLFEPSQLDSLRHTAWNMFDHGFSSYMKHAFPMVGAQAPRGLCS